MGVDLGDEDMGFVQRGGFLGEEGSAARDEITQQIRCNPGEIGLRAGERMDRRYFHEAGEGFLGQFIGIGMIAKLAREEAHEAGLLPLIKVREAEPAGIFISSRIAQAILASALAHLSHLCPSRGDGREPDVSNLLVTGACAFTVAGWTCAHATRPQ